MNFHKRLVHFPVSKTVKVHSTYYENDSKKIIANVRNCLQTKPLDHKGVAFQWDTSLKYNSIILIVN